MRRMLTAVLLIALPALALASGGEGHSNPWVDLALKFVNFGILIGLFFYLLRKIVPQALKDRQSAIAKELTEARDAQKAAEAKLAEYKERVATLSAEIEKMKVDFKAEGEEAKKRIIADAQAAADQIRANAAAAGDREVRKAVEELKAEVARLSLEMAEKLLTESYGPADHEKAMAQTIEKIEGLQ